MAQTILRGNLSVVGFPFVSEFGGRSVVIPQLDENYLPKAINSTTSDSDHDRGIPQVSYGHNIVPVGQGYKSVAYNAVVGAVVGHTDFFKTQVVRDSAGNKALLGFTSAGGIYMLASSVVSWTPIVIAGWTGANLVTFAFCNGNTYVCLQGLGIYLVVITAPGLTLQVLTGITAANMLGICDSNNYLICFDSQVIYWSSTTNVLDFVPSLITGAGSATPNDLSGLIILVAGLNNGFVIYSSACPIVASYSGNTNYPWIFRSAAFGAGLTKEDSVTQGDGLGFHWAWTTAGLIKVTSGSGCSQEFPELTDFLAGKIYEDYDTGTKTFTRTYLGARLVVRLAFIGSRYLVISYGLVDEQYTYALVYDTAFSRWGKLKINHVSCFELGVNTTGGVIPYTTLAGTLYSAYTTTPYTLLTGMSNLAADAKSDMAFLQADGTVQLADFSFGNYDSDAVLMLGKFELNRNQLCTLEQFDVEGVDAANSNFDVSILFTIDGSNYLPYTIPTPEITQGRLRKFNMRVTGMNHSVCCHGAFHITSTVFAFSQHGRR